ncbi:DUF4405 domain-containing protein [Rhodospirillum rubrum]|uniref:Flavinylation-associated cytochrome domain-containing protein n=1 Tax=Rhodospirillum rubrum (strain ATCC 11170 / ATH 1.1.1 / DSM 467 / LMG 4362 / NCIMB 8255 / S1) TaxID=269796 RepID=Q2RX07_RHORT|nr:DUF4405 domain-containing protein [Rhodospirillum rubrum]ABC21338.1 conserved hypothetical protein [Rhodospirillum rubrum ATCC 11170]AEO47018.1 hypothetical protein F11_02740 [Rhodospirillum rubrum F11]MBK5952924.1 hypothetical protein [Rhodospirillum rubrum]QXG81019.1 DUF4405 domain-containing protein [Rhodospirillum rubrum]HAQ00187.1 DUF4405 domain-containing protein [Rhodospirillum rubrum]
MTLRDLPRLVRRDLLTPVTAILFLVIAISGIMLFWHQGEHLVKDAHEWLGMGFIGVACWHLWTHRKSVAAALKRPLPRWGFAGATALAVVVVMATASTDGKQGSPKALIGSLMAAPLPVVAQVVGADPQVLVNALEARGWRLPSSQATALEIASLSGGSPMAVLAVAQGLVQPTP